MSNTYWVRLAHTDVINLALYLIFYCYSSVQWSKLKAVVIFIVTAAFNGQNSKLKAVLIFYCYSSVQWSKLKTESSINFYCYSSVQWSKLKTESSSHFYCYSSVQWSKLKAVVIFSDRAHAMKFKLWLLHLRMYLWWSLCTLYLHARQVKVTVGDSGLCCTFVTLLYFCYVVVLLLRISSAN